MSVMVHETIERMLRSQARTVPAGPLPGEDLVVLSHQRWATHVTAVHNLVVRLARHNRVLFVEPPDSMAWLLHEPPAREAMTWLLDPLERRGGNLYVYHTPPLFLPGQGRRPWIARSVTATYEYLVRRALVQAGFRRPIYWVFQFNAVWLVRALRARLVVYECAEEWAENTASPAVRRYIEQVDEQMCRTADLVFVPSSEMLRRKSPRNPHTYRVPWGVDIGLYATARRPETRIPEEIARLPRPIIGIVGMFDGRRLHVELLVELARRHRNWSVVLVGRCMPNLDTRPLTDEPNIHLYGMRPVEALPAYCKGFDVCILPYRVVEFTRSILPLKLVEYLATGKPVVTTAIPAAREFRDVYYVADTIDEFDRMVAEAIDEDGRHAAARVRRAAAYDWNAIAERKMAMAAERLRAKAGRNGQG